MVNPEEASWMSGELTYRGSVDDGAVGGDRVLALLHHGHLVAAVVGGVGEAVDRAALRAG